MKKEEEAKLHQEVGRANKARQLLNNSLLKESLDQLKELYNQGLLNTGAKEVETREKLWQAYQIVGKVEQHIKEIIDTGKLATKQLDDFRNPIKTKKF
jgi:hypothetical protein|tara:strand:- start:99 stop:392 length:294 start_codon:yes stop_codon:yes gene_type:complete